MILMELKPVKPTNRLQSFKLQFTSEHRQSDLPFAQTLMPNAL